MSEMSFRASFEAPEMILCKGVGENCGNLIFISLANLCPSGQSRLSGVPRTEQILNNSSISEFPGKSGLNVYSSAVMHPTAQMSMGAE